VEPSVAIVPWGDVVEDFLDPIGLSLEGFCEELGGGWLFGYVEALQRVGVRPVLVAVSRGVEAPLRRTHRQTGAPVWFLPVPERYRYARRLLKDPYATHLDNALRPMPRWQRPAGVVARHLAPYLAWPMGAFDRVVREEGCSAILTQEYEYARFDLLVAYGRRRGIPVVASYQGGTWQVSALERVVRPHALRASAGLVVGSSVEVERLSARYGIELDQVHRVYNPLDLEGWTMPPKQAAREALGIPPGARVATWHGRVVFHTKGIDVLLAAWERITAERPGQDLRLLLVGTGDDAERLHRELERPAMSGVRWRDEYVVDKAEIRQVLAAADAYVFPSRHEGFPGALVEALASGLPAAAAAAPGVADILGIGEGAEVGIMVPREDPAALAAALGRLLDEPETAERWGVAARRRAEDQFGLDAVGAQLRHVLFPAE
jgi:glycosyltransferase involved in cell wall biosynthesis